MNARIVFRLHARLSLLLAPSIGVAPRRGSHCRNRARVGARFSREVAAQSRCAVAGPPSFSLRGGVPPLPAAPKTRQLSTFSESAIGFVGAERAAISPHRGGSRCARSV